ncbi:MAG TPA: transporter associated domain-containing protein, partial [Streptosporangiaceae bacterium]
VDEYGGTAGIVTLEDLVEELIGDIRDEYDTEEGTPRQLHGGQLEVDGLLNLDEFAEQTGVGLPEGPYETVAGFVLATLGQLPGVGDAVEVDGHRLTVTEMDGRRIARVRVGPVSPAVAEAAAGADGSALSAAPTGAAGPAVTGLPPKAPARGAAGPSESSESAAGTRGRPATGPPPAAPGMSGPPVSGASAGPSADEAGRQ